MEDQKLIIEKIVFSKDVLEIRGNTVLLREFTSLRFDRYPVVARFVVNVDFHSVASAGLIQILLAVRIRRGKQLVYESAPEAVHVESNSDNISMSISARLEEVKFLEPGSYLVEIMLDGQAVHREELLVEKA